MHINHKDHPELWAIAKSVGYNGKHLEAKAFSGPQQLSSYWSDGNRTYWYFFDLRTGQRVELPECGGHPCQPDAISINEVPSGMALVEDYHNGRGYSYCIIHLNPNDITPMLPPADECPNKVRIVLHFTGAYKNSYMGRSNLRYHYYKDAGGKMTPAEWESAQAEGYRLGYLNKAGAITPKGRNLRDEHWTQNDKAVVEKWEAT